jgi:hypothetical protein
MSDIELTEADLAAGAQLTWTTTNDLLGQSTTHSGEIVEIRTKSSPDVWELDEEHTRVVVDTGDEVKELTPRSLLDGLGGEHGSLTVEEFTPADANDGQDDDANDDQDSDGEDDPDAVADGGEDVTDHIDDTAIEAAIERHDDPDHPDATTVDEVRDIVAAINRSLVECWAEHEDAIDDGHTDIVHEDRAVIVLADHTGHAWSEEFAAVGVDDEVTQAVVKSLVHDIADRWCDHSWATAAPLVLRKPAAWRAGEEHALRAIARGTRESETGRVASSADRVATDIHGWRRSDWARLSGRNPSSVTRNLDNAD